VKKVLFVFVCLSLFALGCKKAEVVAPVATEEVAVETTETTTEVATSTETAVTPEATQEAVTGN
jgi:hypothetical protein